MTTLRPSDTAPDFAQDSVELAQRFPKGFKAVHAYLRITPQSSK